jgi:hypothetical protein
MTIQTDITLKDLKIFGRHVATGADGGRLMYTLLIGSGVAVGIILGVTLAVSGVRLDVASLMAGLLGGAFWLTIFSRLYMRKMAPVADSHILGPRTVSVTDDGIIEKSQKHEALFRWPSIRSVDSVNEHIFVMLERNVGIIVPCRAFSSDTERNQFLAEVRKRTGTGTT